MRPLHWIGRKLAHYLSAPRELVHVSTSRPGLLAATLCKGDVLLVEGTSRFASAIRTITQSNWSHAALFIGDALTASTGDPAPLFVEADINAGVRAVPLDHYAHLHTRICRPVGLDDTEIDALIAYAVARIGNQYDLRNVIDLARYLVRPPPVPDRYRRRLLAFGGGDPTRAICSSLIAAAFASIRYPVLPDIELVRGKGVGGEEQAREILHIRDSSLYAPRDFDMSPYFRIVKPTLQHGFDPHALTWAPAADQD
ncbi:YiiX/YebB-like N1pC/P60 family cysteine hydrolase [Dokdonella soli]|uniref:Lipo-like protein n=1 Tax=Dokdonella soli TaxID=529810 RepID=A0ABN1IQ82_9GAMM